MVEAGFLYGLSAGALSSSEVGTYSNGSISARLSGLTVGTTYYYKAYVTVKGTGDKESTRQTFYGDAKSFRTADLPTWLQSYEIPANNAASISVSNTLYNGYYSHSTVNETYGDTKAAIYNTSSSNQKIVVHTFEYDSKVQSNYSMLFDRTRKCALWVAYKHNKTEYADKNVGRNDDGWSSFDPALDHSWQANLSSSYRAAAGLSYDRGHQVASEDRQTTVDQNKQTFYYSNMTPQYSILNQQAWRTSVEARIQAAATVTRANQELYVVTGPLFEGTVNYTKDASGADCALPTGYYKCVIMCTYNSSGEITAANGCAFIVETNSENTAATVTSIDYVESKTGFDFFANIPDSFENAAEAQSVIFWN